MGKRRRRSRNRFDNVPNRPIRHDARTFSSVAPVLLNEDTDGQAMLSETLSHRSPEREYHPSSINGTQESLLLPGSGGDTETGDAMISETPTVVFEIPSPPNEQESNAVVECRTPITNWRVLWALLHTSGNQRLTKEQYQSLRLFSGAVLRDSRGDWKESIIADCNPEFSFLNSSQIPHYSTLYKYVKPALLRSLTVRSLEHKEIVNLQKAGARSRQKSLSGDPLVAVKTVLPSEYARADVATPRFFDAIRSTSLEYYRENSSGSIIPRISSIDCVDLLPVVAAREWFYGIPRSIAVDECSTNACPSFTAEAGDVLSVSLLEQYAEELDEAFTRCFVRWHSSPQPPKIGGKVLDVWAVNHSKRFSALYSHRNSASGDEELSSCLSDHDKRIRVLFDCVAYTSPSDSVTVDVPDLPDANGDENETREEEDEISLRRRRAELKELKRLRKAALEQRKRQLEQAWRTWEKPILKPGDTVALLCPCPEMEEGCSETMLTSTDRCSRILLVSRYWVEQGERSTHIVWVPGGIDLESQSRGLQKCAIDLHPFCRAPVTSSARLYAHAKQIVLVHQHSGPRGPQKSTPVSSFGRLSTGELYCVYRFVLFWDGFAVQDGKEASGDGIYLLSLNLPTHSNRTPNDVRIISLTPPGVKSDTVLRVIVKDVVKGMTEGFEDVDAHGDTRRIFLDLVGFIGDTPALNAFLDVLGHNAVACCHLCRYTRQSTTIVGSRFTGMHPNSLRTAMKRGLYQQRAVRDCAPGKEACRLLGVKADPDLSSSVLHYFTSEILSAKSLIPKTSEGHPVVPCALDPYKACFIAPDHLLTSHLRDCLNLAIILLPSADARRIFEGFMIGMLRDCALPAQSRLINHEKKKLLSMTMSELYAIGVVAPHALRKSQKVTGVSEASGVVQEKIKASLGLVDSASRLIAEIWFKPDHLRDSTNDMKSFESNYGNDYLQKLQSIVDSHIKLVEKMCAMDNSDAIALEESTGSAQSRSQLARQHALCVLARRTIDKPNVHRLRELAQSTLPMLGHVSVFGELPLEKSHQELKRAIRASNKKDAHLQAVESAIFSDWQGRLTLSASSAIAGNSEDLFACFRLLTGREMALHAKNGLNASQIQLVLSCINDCIVQDLSSQAIGVLSKRLIISQSRLTWNLLIPTLVRLSFTTEPEMAPQGEAEREAIALLRRIFAFQWTKCIVKCSKNITCTTSSRIPASSFSKGDIVETLTTSTATLDSHYPFVLQATLVDHSSRFNRQHAPSLWCTECFFSVENEHGNVSFFAAVRPCVPIEERVFGTRGYYHVAQNERLSLAEMDISMRRVPALHTCIFSECTLEQPHNFIRHSNNSVYSDAFVPITRRSGFPPRRG